MAADDLLDAGDERADARAFGNLRASPDVHKVVIGQKSLAPGLPSSRTRVHGDAGGRGRENRLIEEAVAIRRAVWSSSADLGYSCFAASARRRPMKQRLPLILSSTALVVAVFGATPLGHAAGQLVQTVPPFAKKAGYAAKAASLRTRWR